MAGKVDGVALPTIQNYEQVQTQAAKAQKEGDLERVPELDEELATLNPEKTAAVSARVAVSNLGANRDNLGAAVDDLNSKIPTTLPECFIAGTRIRTPGGETPIERLSIGDLVLSMDPLDGRTVEVPVAKILRRTAAGVVELSLRDGRKLGVTREHPFFDPRSGDYRPAGGLKPGDAVLLESRAQVEVAAAQERLLLQVPVFNLSVGGDLHNYLAEGVLVHNKSVPVTKEPIGNTGFVTNPKGGVVVTDPKAAKVYLDKAIAKNPNNPDALALRGVANAQLGNNAAACSDSKAALSLNGSDNSAYSTARLTCPTGSALPALRSPPPTRNPPAQAPASASAVAAGGQALQGTIPMISPMPSRNSPLSGSFLQGALDYMRKGNIAQALDSATSAIQNDPHNVDAWLLRMAALKAGGDWGQVIADATDALKYNPNNLKLLNEKAYAQNRVKDFKGALDTAEQSIAIDPTNAQAYANKAFALGGLGDHEGMLAALKVAASFDPQFQAALDSVLKGTGSIADLFGFPGERQAKAPPANAGRKEALKRLIVAVGVALLIGLSALIARSRRLEASAVRTRTPLASGVSTTPAPTSMPATHLPERLRGKYELGPQIGAGGMGVVFAGKDIPLDRKVAIKKMLPQLAAQEKLRERFVAEAKTVASLHHPNIVDIHDIVEEGQDIYLVFEYVAGKTLSDLLLEKGRFPFFEATKIIHDIAEALEFAHGKNIIHRDLKPSNVMINESGRVIVMDFGLARAVKDLLSQAALTNTIAGTPAYMAPEQEEGVVCKQSDIYSLAVCLYELLSGKRPFEGSPGAMMVSKLATTFKPISKLVSNLPPGIDIFFTCAFAADPKSRPATPKELLSALETMTPAPAART